MLLVHTGIFAYLWYNIYHPGLLLPYYRNGSYILLLLYLLFLVVSNHVFGGLRMGYYKVLDSIVARTLSLLTAYFTMYFVISLLSYRLVNPVPLLCAVGIGLLFNIVWTSISNYIYYALIPPRKMLLIYGDRPTDEIYNKITSRSEKYEIVKRIHCNAGEEKLKQVIEQHEAVILHDLSASLRNHLIKYCYEKIHPCLCNAEAL